jgi:hypothetical protein
MATPTIRPVANEPRAIRGMTGYSAVNDSLGRGRASMGAAVSCGQLRSAAARHGGDRVVESAGPG